MPITILSTLHRRVGALLALILFKKDLDVIALIGIILLIGIVKKNAIMMIDFALEAERKEGKRPEEAIYQACLLRFRPIMDDPPWRAARRRSSRVWQRRRVRIAKTRWASASSVDCWSARC